MDGEARTASRWPLVFGGVVAFGLLVTASGLVLASVPVTVQGVCLTVAGLIGLVLAGLRGVPVRRRLPIPVPWPVLAGALVLVATAVESVRTSPSPWAPLGLLVGVVLLGIPIRALPAAAPRPRAAVALVLVGLVLMIGYEGLQHLLSPEPGDLPSYLAAVGMPFAAAVAAGALAVLAATRGGTARAAAGGGLVLVSAGLYLAEAAGNHWWLRQTFPGYPTGNTGVAMMAVETSSAYETSASFSFAPTDATTVLLVLGLALTVVGWWWAAVRRRAG